MRLAHDGQSQARRHALHRDHRLFFALAGLLATVMRTQLARADNDLVGPDLYNQLFSMHGTAMMFLFAVPVMEAVALIWCR